jgi:hypothetical protein
MLLVGDWLHIGRVGRAPHLHRASLQINADEDVCRSADLGHGENEPGVRVIDWCAGDTERINIAARQVPGTHRVAHVSAPLDLAGPCIQRIERVRFGRDDHPPIDDQGLGIDGAVERLAPSLGQALGVRRVGNCTRAGVVAVIVGQSAAERPTAGVAATVAVADAAELRALST